MRPSLEQFALFGAKPRFDNLLHVGRPNVPDKECAIRRISEALDRRWLSNHGPLVTKFEESAQEYLGIKHAIATCNATIALEVLIECLGITGEVIMPAWTFVASAHACARMKATPVFCDVDPVTHCLDPAMVEQLVSPNTGAILGVHLWGTPCCPEELDQIASQNNIPLLFDAAQALGSTHKGQYLGAFGKAEVFSLHATKALNAFEGGIITTNDNQLADRLRRASNFGFSNYDTVTSPGTNAKMNEASAAMGLTSLENREKIFKSNRKNLEVYSKELQTVPGIRVIHPPKGEQSNFHYIILEIDKRQCGISRNTLVEILTAEGVIARRYFHPGVHRMQPYARNKSLHAPHPLPQTEKLSDSVLALPNGLTVSESDIEIVCSIIKGAIEIGSEIENRVLANDI